MAGKSQPMLRPLAISSLLVVVASPTAWSFTGRISSAGTTRSPRAGGRALRASPVAAAATWTPCAQPNFNEFASYTVGPWITVASSVPSPPPATPRVQEVEEVMRSCGGAVQGIRELPLSSLFEPDEPTFGKDDDDLRTYHNRADGGFVYADDGSYTSGPERWEPRNDASNNDDGVEEGSSDAKPWMASLAFPDRRRVWITARPPRASGEDGATRQFTPKVLELSRPPSTSADGGDDPRIELESDASRLPTINWKAMRRARMPSANQPWSLARAKWETRVVEPDEGSADDVPKGTPGPLVWCVSVDSTSENEGHNLFGDVVTTDATSVRMVAACPTSRVARAAVRCYGPDSALRAVAFLDGSW